MYWYKSAVKYVGFMGVLLLLCGMYACTKPEIKETGAELKYFDLKGYFEADSARLARADRTITKTVTHNGNTESKTVKIANWGREFNLFKESDINKPAWRQSYNISVNGDDITYTAKFPELKTREITIKKVNGQVTGISIKNKVQNFLYTTTEQLNYVPGSFYTIDKSQHVKVLGTNEYLIKGRFANK